MLNKLFVSEVRVKILKLMLLNPEKSLHVRAIVRGVGAEINAVRRELDNLVEIGLFRRRQSSNRIYYTVNADHPFFGDLMSLVAKENGIAPKLYKGLKNLGDIEYILLSKSFLRGRKSTALDVDLFVVGDVNADVLEKIIKDEESATGREINYAVMGSEEFMSRKRTMDQFIERLMSQGRAMLFGDEEKFCATVE
jgi:predicted ArsR family transcriptional regulator